MISTAISKPISQALSGRAIPRMTPEQFAAQLSAEGRLRVWDYAVAVRYRNHIDHRIRFFPDTGSHESANGPEANPNPQYSNESIWVPSHENSVAGGTVLTGNGELFLNSNNSATIDGRILVQGLRLYKIDIPVLSVGNGTVTINTTNSVGIGKSSETFAAAGVQTYPVYTYEASNLRILMSSTASPLTPAIIGVISVKYWDGVHWVQETPARRPTATKHGFIYDGSNSQWMWGRYIPTGLMGTDPNGTVLVYGTGIGGTILQIVQDGGEGGNHCNLMVQNTGGGGTIFCNSTVGGNHKSGESANSTYKLGSTQLSENAGISGQQNRTYRDGVQCAKQIGTTDDRWKNIFNANPNNYTAIHTGRAANTGSGYLTATILRIVDADGVNETTPEGLELLRRFAVVQGDTSVAGAIERINDEVPLTGTQEEIFIDLRNALIATGYDNRVIDYTFTMLDQPEANRLWHKSILSSWHLGGTTTHENREIELSDDAYVISPYNGNSLVAKGWSDDRHGFFFSRSSVSPATGGDEWDAGISGLNGRTNTGNDGAWFESGGDAISEGSAKPENPAAIYYFSRCGRRMSMYRCKNGEVTKLAETFTATNPLPVNDDLFTLGCKCSTGTGATFAGHTNAKYRMLAFTLPIEDAAAEDAMAAAILPLFEAAEQAFAAT